MPMIKDPTFNIYRNGGNVENKNKQISKKELIKLASETYEEEKALSDFMDMKYDEALRLYLKNNPNKTEDDFLKDVKRISLESGGKVIDLARYRKGKEPEIKKINLADYFELGKTVSSLSDKDRALVNKLLRMSLGKE